MEVLNPKRGEVWWVAFDPSVGSEIQKTRPAVVISNDRSNRHLDRFQVIPVTTQIDKLYPGEAFIELDDVSVKVMCNQMTTSSIRRFVKKYAVVSSGQMSDIETALKVQLGLK